MGDRRFVWMMAAMNQFGKVKRMNRAEQETNNLWPELTRNLVCVRVNLLQPVRVRTLDPRSLAGVRRLALRHASLLVWSGHRN